jgi:adenine-specific DNA methylase
MKRLQEFTNIAGKYNPNIETHIRRVSKLPLPYTGNKKKILFQIYKVISNIDMEFNTIIDAFSGSSCFSMLMKLMGKRVISNDILTSSYLNSVAFVENPGIKLSDDEKSFLLNNNNPNKSTFVEDNYLGGSSTSRFSKFTLKECRHLDNFRANIDELCGLYRQSIGMSANAAVIMRLPFGNVDASVDVLKHRVKQEEHYGKLSKNHDRRIGIYYDDKLNLLFSKWFVKYLDDFTSGINSECAPEKIKRASFLVNLQQHILRDCMVQGRLNNGQSLAELDVRLSHPKNQSKNNWDRKSTEMDFHTKSGKCASGGTGGAPGQGLKWWTFSDINTDGSCVSTNMDVIDLLRMNIKADCIYFDPPYGGQSSDYATIYRFLEEYIYSEQLENLPHIQSASRFSKRANYEDNFIEMLTCAKYIPIWLFSYNDSSWKSIEYIWDMIRQFKTNVKVETLNDSYRYNYRKKQGREKRSIEYLIVAY